ncbi:hypothetical protein OG555_18630 [Kribbella sp. NBC_01484]|uniref:hypothetical protein n=1 Tax=Kribbella sp. NBC_01484 TaxID=2903579 RepID=UPI002E3771B7|nr:hypothetical protein [Kribbella sp. NBC_01484]
MIEIREFIFVADEIFDGIQMHEGKFETTVKVDERVEYINMTLLSEIDHNNAAAQYEWKNAESERHPRRSGSC